MELIPGISNRTIDKCENIYGQKVTSAAVSCIYHWYDKFYTAVFKPAKPMDNMLIKAVIYLLITNDYNGIHKAEYIEYTKTH
jgi:hypothetical protein